MPQPTWMQLPMLRQPWPATGHQCLKGVLCCAGAAASAAARRKAYHMLHVVQYLLYATALLWPVRRIHTPLASLLYKWWSDTAAPASSRWKTASAAAQRQAGGVRKRACNVRPYKVVHRAHGHLHCCLAHPAHAGAGSDAGMV